MFRKRSRGQTTLEVVMLIGFVVAALIAMSVYMKRGVQGKLRDSSDQIGDQYSAGNTESTYTTTIGMTQDENLIYGGATTTNISRNSQSKTGTEVVSDFSPGY